MPDTILIVDDTPANLSVLAECLSTAGYSLMVAEDGEEALSQTKLSRPSLILLDVMMPGIDGFETCRRFKTSAETRDIPVIFMTALADTSEKVRAFNAGAVDYITKPIQHAEALARINTHLTLCQLRRELEKELALKQKFMRIAAHDLRNPLCLLLMASAQARRKGAPPAIAEQLENIDFSARQMQSIIDTFLNVQKPGTGRVNLNVLAQAVVAQNEPAAQNKNISLTLQATEPLPVVSTEAGHAYQALTNYVSNAVKFLSTDQHIIVRTHPAGKSVRVEVQDDGPGVPLSERTSLFTEYAKLSARPTGGEESTGLGLSIVKQLIESQGGKVGAEFPAAGGSIFWFELPAGS